MANTSCIVRYGTRTTAPHSTPSRTITSFALSQYPRHANTFSLVAKRKRPVYSISAGRTRSLMSSPMGALLPTKAPSRVLFGLVTTQASPPERTVSSSGYLPYFYNSFPPVHVFSTIILLTASLVPSFGQHLLIVLVRSLLLQVVGLAHAPAHHEDFIPDSNHVDGTVPPNEPARGDLRQDGRVHPRTSYRRHDPQRHATLCAVKRVNPPNPAGSLRDGKHVR